MSFLIIEGDVGIVDADGNKVNVVQDGSYYRLAVSGKFTSSPPPVPPAASPVNITNATPLELSGTVDSEYVIPNGQSFSLLQIIAGAGGDPTERGSAVELFYTPDNGATLKIVQRIYVSGFTVAAHYGPQEVTRDGTAMTGNGTTTKLILRRRRLSGSAQEVDAVVQGYVQ